MNPICPCRLRRWAQRGCRAGAVASASAFVVLAGAALAAAPAAAAPVAGAATIVAAKDGSAGAGAPLAMGTGDTWFSLQLPAGAACSGDSTDGGYRVQSFMVAGSVDPASLTFGALGPLPKGVGAAFRQPLYQVNTTSYANAATNLADAPGGQGVIINVPSFDLRALSPGDLPPRDYNVGIACTKGPASPAQLDRFWTTKLTLSAGAGPDPLRWVAAAPSQPAGTGSDEPAATPRARGGAGPAGAAGQATTPADTGATPVPAAGTASESGATSPTDTPDTPPEAGVATPPGGQPTFTLAAAEAVTLLSVDGNTAQSLGIWLFLALVFARIALLLARRTAVVPPAFA